MNAADLDPAAPPMNDLLHTLASTARRLTGAGVNHAGEHFVGRLDLAPLVGGHAVLMHYHATRDDGEHLHREATLLGRLPDGRLCLWPVMEELPFVLAHPALPGAQRDDGTLEVVFASAARDAVTTFREEITLQLAPHGAITYAHAWGMPNEAFAARSHCVLTPDA